MSTLGESVFGRGKSVDTMLLFTIGTGIGGGVIIDRRLRLGPLGAVGELGHQTLQPDGPLCGLEGILVDLGRHSHLVLSIELLQRSIAVQVPRDAIMPIPAKARVASANRDSGFAYRDTRGREVARSAR